MSGQSSSVNTKVYTAKRKYTELNNLLYGTCLKDSFEQSESKNNLLLSVYNRRVITRAV